MDKQQAIYDFWRKATGLPCYESGAVPDDAQLPYCTYETVIDALDSVVPASASIWDRKLSWATLDGILKSVSDYIYRGRLVPIDGGRILINTASPFAQRIEDDVDSSIKGYNINIQIEYFTST